MPSVCQRLPNFRQQRTWNHIALLAMNHAFRHSVPYAWSVKTPSSNLCLRITFAKPFIKCFICFLLQFFPLCDLCKPPFPHLSSKHCSTNVYCIAYTIYIVVVAQSTGQSTVMAHIYAYNISILWLTTCTSIHNHFAAVLKTWHIKKQTAVGVGLWYLTHCYWFYLVCTYCQSHAKQKWHC